MPRLHLRISAPAVLQDVLSFAKFLHKYLRIRGYNWFAKFEVIKDVLVDLLYKKRGKYARPLLHFGTIGLIFLVIILGPVLLAQAEEAEGGQANGSGILTNSSYMSNFTTLQAEEVRQYRGGEVITHAVQEGETLSTIAQRYGVQVDTLLWENDLTEKSKIKPGQELRILPIDGVRHKVKRGETLASVGKKYGLEDSATQAIVDYPFNEFLNNETFELATGQYLIIPGGVPPKATVTQPKASYASVMTPDAGAVSASGSFVWPASGRITQGYSFYHKAIDIANRSGGPILASDGGVVTVAGWPDNSGYGNRIIVDHGNGFVSLYAHLSVIQVRAGQRVNKGDVIGQMGNTGRSTGTHLHFEIRQGGLLNPLSFLN